MSEGLRAVLAVTKRRIAGSREATVCQTVTLGTADDRMKRRNARYWHKADMGECAANVCFQE